MRRLPVVISVQDWSSKKVLVVAFHEFIPIEGNPGLWERNQRRFV